MPEWWNCTRANALFARSAAALATALEETYGEGFSITRFEKVLAELPSLSEEQKSQLYIESSLLNLFKEYRVNKEARDSERESFRSFRSVEAIAAGLEMADSVNKEDEKQRGN
jgi:hypothetical protein